MQESKNLATMLLSEDMTNIALAVEIMHGLSAEEFMETICALKHALDAHLNDTAESIALSDSDISYLLPGWIGWWFVADGMAGSGGRKCTYYELYASSELDGDFDYEVNRTVDHSVRIYEDGYLRADKTVGQKFDENVEIALGTIPSEEEKSDILRHMKTITTWRMMAKNS